jgi:hypothetical protein
VIRGGDNDAALAAEDLRCSACVPLADHHLQVCHLQQQDLQLVDDRRLDGERQAPAPLIYLVVRQYNVSVRQHYVSVRQHNISVGAVLAELSYEDISSGALRVVSRLRRGRY